MKESKMDQVSQDAAEFGVYVRSGGWRLGLLVARSVQPGVGGRGNTGVSQSRNPEKVSAKEFARQSNTSADRVLRYLDAWSKAAEAGLVPPAADLNPGIEVGLPDDEKAPWSDFYSAGRSSTDDSVLRSKPSVARNIAADPKFASFAADAIVASDHANAKREMFKRLAADPAVSGHDRTRYEAETAMSEANHTERHERRDSVQQAKNKTSAALGYVAALLALDASVTQVQRAAEHWIRGGPSWTDEQRAEFRTRWTETLHEIEMAGRPFTDDLDNELADLLGGDR